MTYFWQDFSHVILLKSCDEKTSMIPTLIFKYELLHINSQWSWSWSFHSYYKSLYYVYKAYQMQFLRLTLFSNTYAEIPVTFDDNKMHAQCIFSCTFSPASNLDKYKKITLSFLFDLRFTWWFLVNILHAAEINPMFQYYHAYHAPGYHIIYS